MNGNTNRNLFALALLSIALSNPPTALPQSDPNGEMGDTFRPSYEMYRMDNLTMAEDLSYTGDLNFSIPLISVPGRHGNAYNIAIDYSSNITQRQAASWVGLGWSLEIGSVQRTVMGRFDEQGIVPHASLGGKADSAGWASSLHDQLSAGVEDQVDLYRLTLGGMSLDLLPKRTGYQGFLEFHPTSHRPSWRITCSISGDLIQWFNLVTEDGTKYHFGKPLTVRLDRFDAENGFIVTFRNAYKWLLTKIEYPNGAQVMVKYSPVDSVQDYYGNLFVDRNMPDGGAMNVFGAGGHQSWPDLEGFGRVTYQHAWPETLFTDTHYAKFHHSPPAVINSSYADRDKFERTDTQRKLDEIVVKQIGTHIKLMRAKFTYAADSSSTEEYREGQGSQDAKFPAWQANQRLNNNQLTLANLNIQHASGETDLIPPYEFGYHGNPKVSWLHQLTWSRYDSDFPGYHIDKRFSAAWKLKQLRIPTGALIIYDYDTLGVDYEVRYDPEGNVTQPSSLAWSYQSQPKGRIRTKAVTDPLYGTSQMWRYSYGKAVFDPPSRPSGLQYVPRGFRGSSWSDMDYYKMFRGCLIGHRWMKVILPDSSWKKVHYTSSFKDTGFNGDSSDPTPFDSRESRPDTIAGLVGGSYPPYAARVIRSVAPTRGLIWKVESAIDTVITTYAFDVMDSLVQRAEYFTGLSLAASPEKLYRVRDYRIWVRETEVRRWQDGIESFTETFYDEDNQLISARFEGVPWSESRATTYTYAYKQPGHEGMDALMMRSQLYSRTVTGQSGYSSKTTKWREVGAHWRPSEEWEGIGSSTPVRVKTYGSYDAYGNLLQSTDGNGFVTKYFYGTNNDPFPVGQTSSSRSLLTGIERPYGLRVAVERDHYGKVTKKTDENGDVQTAAYDSLGRLKQVRGPGNLLLNEYSYAYAGSGYGPLTPNAITSKQYRSANDYTHLTGYYNGSGYDIQSQTRLGTNDVVFHRTYDAMGRPERAYKPYLANTGHTFDSSHFSRAVQYYGQSGTSGVGNYPFTTSQYYHDGSGRLKQQHAPGDTFHNISGNRYVRQFYGSNRDGEVLGYEANQLSKTTTIDENQNKTHAFTDRWGNTVCTVIDSAGLSLKTLMSYDALGRVTSVVKPNSYGTQHVALKDSFSVFPSMQKDSITFPLTPSSGRVATVTVTAFDNGAMRPENGITVWFTIKQFSQGVLQPAGPWLYYLYHNPDPGFGPPASISYVILPEVDHVRFIVDSVWYFNGINSGKVVFQVENGPSESYVYDSRGLLSLKASMDAGLTAFRYDSSGNLRFQQSAQQRADNRLTYSKYDSLNRLAEVGEWTAALSEIPVVTSGIPSYDAPTNSDSLFRTRNFYDTAVGSGIGGRNLLSRLACTVASNDGIKDSTFYSYDDFGRIEWQLQKLAGLAPKKLTYSYDRQGNLTTFGYLDLGNANNNTWFFYEYDQLGRLSGVFSGLDSTGSARIHEGAYTYRANSQVQRLQLGIAQGVDYRYNERDWLTQINTTMHDPSGDAGNDGINGIPIDQFGQKIGYYELGDIAAGTGFTAQPQYNGNIAWSIMRTNQIALPGVDAGYPDPIAGMVYNYDKASRLTKADFGYYNESGLSGQWNNADPNAAMYDLPAIEYDKNGNITRMIRYGVNATKMDNLTYHYEALHVSNSPSYDYLVPDSQVGLLNGWDVSPSGSQSYNVLSDNNDQTYVQYHVEYGSSGSVVVGLSNPQSLVDTSRSLEIQFRSRSEVVLNNSEGSITLTVKLLENGQVKGSKQVQYFATTQLANQSFQVAGSGISDFSDLRIELHAYGVVEPPGQGQYVRAYVADVKVRIPIFIAETLGVTNRLAHVHDSVAAGTYSIDIDSQSVGNYTYDGDGNMISDNQASMSLIYDHRNLPTQITKSGVVTKYRYDAAGKRTYKGVANGDTLYYIYDAAGRNLAVLNADGSIRMLNIHGADHLGYMAVTYEQGGEEEEENHDNPGGEGEGQEEEQQSEPGEPTEEGILAGEGILDSEGTEVPEPDATSTEVLVTGPGGRIDKRFYYLKDHLGSVRTTVQSGHLMLWDDFETGFNWLHIESSGFGIEDGRMVNLESGEQIVIEQAPRVLSDGIVTVDVRFTDYVESLENPEREPEAALLVRYRNPQGYYAIGVCNASLAIYRRTSSAFVQEAYAPLPEEAEINNTYKLQVTVEGNRILVFWNQQYILHWDDPNPWLTGKVGFRHLSSTAVEWDNIKVTTGSPGKIVAYDDYDPWGMVLEGRSGNVSNADARFKFLTKEHDPESGHDWLDARGYDSRIGRFVTIDPLADQGVLRSWSPYHYSFNNPMRFCDRTGMMPGDDDENAITQTWNAVKSIFTGSKTSESLPESDSPLSSEGQAAVQGINSTVEAGKENVQEALQATAGFAEDYAGVTQAAGVAAGLVAVAVPPTAPILGPVAAGMLSVSTGSDVLALGARVTDAMVFGGSQENVASQGAQVLVDVAANKVTRGALGLVVRQTGFAPAFRSASTGRFISDAVGFSARAAADISAVALGTSVSRTILQK